MKCIYRKISKFFFVCVDFDDFTSGTDTHENKEEEKNKQTHSG